MNANRRQIRSKAGSIFSICVNPCLSVAKNHLHESATLEDLDPQVFGVIVEDQKGIHRGLLLPNLEGVDTVTKQVEIASRKAGIALGTDVRLFRFRAQRYSE